MEEALRRVEANRRNGSRGGVKTAQGKTITRLNAQRHGFFSRHLVLRNQWVQERQIDFDRLLAELQADREPVGVEENLAIRQLAIAYWRLMTLQRAEKQLVEQRLEQVDDRIRSDIDRVDKDIQEVMVPLRGLKWRKSHAALVKGGTITIEDFERAYEVDLLQDLKGMKRYVAEGRPLCKYMGETFCADISSASLSDKVNAFKLYDQGTEMMLAEYRDYLLLWRNERRALVKQLEPFLDLALIPAGSEGERITYYKDRLRKRIHRWHLRLYALQNARLKKAEHQCPEAKVKYISPPIHSAQEEKEKKG